jgi:hypothetical protein
MGSSPAVSRSAKFPLIPVEPGIFSIILKKCGSGTKKDDAAQCLESKFPYPGKREFIWA